MSMVVLSSDCRFVDNVSITNACKLVAFDAVFFGFGQPNRQRGVTPSLFTHNYHSPFLNSVGSGCRP